MAKSNGHSSNGHSEPLRAPRGGVRVKGKFFKGGALMPERYRRTNGEHIDPATNVPLAAPNFSRFALPHAITFVGKQSTIANVYRNPDEAIQRAAGQAWKMRRDPVVMGPLEARQRSVALLNWHLEVEDEKDPKQKELQTELTKIIKRSWNFTEYRRCLLEALWYGRYAVQHKFGFEQVGGKRRCIVQDWRPINGDKLIFRFDDGSGKYSDDEVGIRVTPIYGQHDKLGGDRKLEITDQGMAYFLEPWERSMVAIHRHIIEDGDYEDPISAGRVHGVGIRDRIWWCWYQKQETMAQMMEVINRTGSGITIYWYPAGDDAAKEAQLEIAEKQRYDNVLVMPRMSGDPANDAYGIERIEPTATGVQLLQGVVHEFFGHQIVRYIAGQTLSSESSAMGIGSGAADFQSETWGQIVKYDAVKLEETITHELINRALKPFNFPWAKDIPVWFRIDTQSSESHKKLEAIKSGWDMGLRIKASDVMDVIGLSMPGEDDETLQNPALIQQARLAAQQFGGQEEGQDELRDLFGPLADLVSPEDQAAQGGPPQPGGDQGMGAEQPAEGEEPAMPPGPAKYAKERKEFSSTQFNLTGDLAFEIRHLAEQIHWDDLAEKGRETEPHITVKFGLHTNDPEVVRRAVQDCAPIAIQLGAASHFQSDAYDVVKIDVQSESLHALNRHICENLETTDTYPDYKPHITIAYVRPGLGALYASKLNALQGRVVAFDRLIYSDKDRQHFSIPLTAPARYAKPKPSAGQMPLWREELHPRVEGGEHGGEFQEKSGGGMHADEWLAKVEESSRFAHDSPTAQAIQSHLFKTLATADIHPEQVKAMLSGDKDHVEGLKQHAMETGQHEPFGLSQQSEKIGLGLGAGDKTPLSGGKQQSMWHGMDDKPGQKKMFDGMDLGGPEEPAAEQPTKEPPAEELSDHLAESGKMVNEEPEADDPEEGEWNADSEAALAQKAQAGDKAARNELIKQFTPLAKHLARKAVQGGRDDYDDFAQVGLIAINRAIDRFDPSQARFSTFATTAITRAIVRTKQKAAQSGAQLGEDEPGHTFEPEESRTKGPAEEADLREQKAWLTKALDKLPEHHALVLRRNLEGGSQREIAKEMGLSTGRVSQIHAEALAKLKRMQGQKEFKALNYTKSPVTLYRYFKKNKLWSE